MSAAENKAVFLSYASQDAEAARRICEALRTAGVEVWFDQSELVGGDAWDAKIRKQIRECALFVPVISANTDARPEGYFRLEWKLAVDRSHLMSHDHPFLFPVVIDDTPDATARVPDKFREVQWTRLNVRDTPESLAGRIAKLLGRAAEPSRSAYGERNVEAASRKDSSPRWLRSAWTIFGLLVGVGFAVVPLWNAFHEREKPKAVAAPATVQLSEARKLVAQARALFEDGDQANHENFFLAEDLLKKAESLDSTDGEAWAAHAQLSSDMFVLRYDQSNARREAWRAQAERAKKLAPDSVEAQVAYASYLIPAGVSSAAEAAQTLEKLAELAPNHRRLFRMLGIAWGFARETDKAVAAFARGNAIAGGDPEGLRLESSLLVWNGRYDEAETAVKQSLAARDTSLAQMHDVLLRLMWRGDLDGAAEAVSRWPAWLLLEERGAFVASQVWLWRREPDKAIAVLTAVSRDFFSDTFFTGPKAGLIALAHEMAGRPEAARTEWENAKKVTSRIAADDPAIRRALAWKACALARLGETAEAESIFRDLEQTQDLYSEFWSCGAPSALLRIALGHGAEVAAKFDTERRTLWVNRGVPSPQAALKLNPVFEPIRATPEFQRWMASAPAPKPKSDTSAVTLVQADEKSVAVLAFADLSAAHDSEYFSDGISEELLNVLAKVPGLKVTARTSSFFFKGKQVPIPEIAQKLGVAYVIEGSVQRAGDQIKITAQLIKAADGFHVWSDTFKRDAKDVFAVEEEIAGLIAKNLSLKLGVSSAAATMPVDPEAYRLALLARAFAARGGRENLTQAIQHLQSAVERDPKFALGFALLSLGHSTFAGNGWEPFNSGFELARAAALHALELQPDLAEAHTAMGWVQYGFDWDWTAARASFRKAVELSPSEAIAQDGLARVALTLGQHDDAIRFARRAVELNPLDGFTLATLCIAHLHAGGWSDAATVDARRIEVTGTNNGYTATALLLQGRNEAAWQAAQQMEASTGFRFFVDALVQWSLGRTAESDAALNAGKAKFSETAAYQIAEIYAWRGAASEAFNWLETSYRQRDTGMIWLKTDPLLKKLHADPRWPELLRKMKLAEDQLK